jgi:hypothetical protein
MSDLEYDKEGRCIASPYRRGLQALGTNPRTLGTNERAKARNKWALRKWKGRWKLLPQLPQAASRGLPRQ